MEFTVTHSCPICFWAMPHPASPGYICQRCGTKFGADNRTHDEIREAWLSGGMQWWSKDRSKPPVAH